MKIFLKNSVCKIEGAEDWVLEELDEALSYTDSSAEYAYTKTLKAIKRFNRLIEREENPNIRKAYQSKLNQLKFMIKKHDADRKIYLIDAETDEFPSGLLNLALDKLDSLKVFWELEDVREVPKKLPELELVKPFPELRYYQTGANEAVLEEERGIIVSPTGTGKSVMFSKACLDLSVNTLIITPNKNINTNAYDTLVEFFGKNEVAKVTKKGELKRINVCNIQTLKNIPPEKFDSLGAVIIDEFHHAAADTYQYINLNHLKNCYYRIGLTATNFRNSGDDLALQAVLSDVIYRYTIKQALTDKFLVPPEFKWIDNKISKAGAKYQKQYKNGIVLNQDRNERIAALAKKHIEDHVIILVQQVEHGQLLADLIPEATLITGKEKDEDRDSILNDFRCGDIRVLIGTSVIGEGVDLPIADTLIMAGGGKARSQVIQNVGRVLRLHEGKKKATIYDFHDRGANYLEDHANQRAEIYINDYSV